MTDNTKTLTSAVERIVANLTPAQQRILDMRFKLGRQPLPKRPVRIPEESPETALLDAIFKRE